MTVTTVYEVQVVIPMSAQRIAQLKDAIHTSTELSALCQFILQDNLRKYWTFHDKLAVYEDIIFKGKRSLIPPSWKFLILLQLHCSHKGVQGTLARARDHVFWPVLCKNVPLARKSKTTPRRNPSARRLWMYVASDLFYYKGKNFLLVADSYLGYFDFHILTSSSSDEVITTLKVWSAQHGIPDELRTNGWPQYVLHQFQKFRDEWNFQHRI
ncbi:hypothetical protein PR048_012873 [Dryococelus australis]|uniref:Integrase catalytic domain-containing protein n=1 Tax=Dryococelus australis TaxID=614101 RepID=A0ABQ9HQQ7_9NEOP|nr:hypothetical protein PR048_012873 [Dryococelus australis]